MLLDPFEYGLRHLLAIGRCSQFARFFRVGNKTCLDQNRGHIGRLEHHKTGLLHMTLVQMRNTAHGVQNVMTHLQAGVERSGH